MLTSEMKLKCLKILFQNATSFMFNANELNIMYGIYGKASNLCQALYLQLNRITNKNEWILVMVFV